MHDLKVERFYKPQMISDQWITAEGPIKTFTLRGIKDSPPYMHDGRCLTLEDTVEFFNMVQGLKLTEPEKTALVAFMRQLYAFPRRPGPRPGRPPPSPQLPPGQSPPPLSSPLCSPLCLA